MMPGPELPSAVPENADDVGAFNKRISKLGDNPAFQNDHLAREETAVVLDQIHDDLDANTQAVYSDVHKFLPELSEPVRLHDGDIISGLEYNNGRLEFHGARFGTLDGKKMDVALDAHERRSGTVVTTDGHVLPYSVEGNLDSEQDEDFPLYPSERRPPLPPLFATGGLPPDIHV